MDFNVDSKYLKLASQMIKQMNSGVQNPDVNIIRGMFSGHQNIFDTNQNGPEPSEVAALLTAANRNFDNRITTKELNELKSKVDSLSAGNLNETSNTRQGNKSDGIFYESDNNLGALKDEVQSYEKQYRQLLESMNGNNNARESSLGQSLGALIPTKNAPVEQNVDGVAVRKSNLGTSLAAFFPKTTEPRNKGEGIIYDNDNK